MGNGQKKNLAGEQEEEVGDNGNTGVKNQPQEGKRMRVGMNVCLIGR